MKAVEVGPTELASVVEEHFAHGWVLLPQYSGSIGRRVRLIFGADFSPDSVRRE